MYLHEIHAYHFTHPLTEKEEDLEKRMINKVAPNMHGDRTVPKNNGN